MTVTNLQIIECLADLGFSEREAKVYVALLNKRHASATDLQKISGVPQSKIYEIIGSLVRRGYCLERKVGRKRSFGIIDPQLTLAPAFEKLQRKLKNCHILKKKIYEIYANSDKVTEPLEYVEILRGNENIHHRYCQLVRDTDEELLGFGRGPYTCDTSEKAREQDNEERAILKRGGIVRWVYEIHLPEEERILEDFKLLQDNGAGIRVAETLPIKMMIFDRKSLLVAEEELLAQRGELVMSIIKQRNIVNAFRALFEFFWNQSVDLEKWLSRHKSRLQKTVEYE